MFAPILPTDSNSKVLLEKITKGGRYTVFGFSREEKLWLLSEIDRPILYIAQDEQDARNIAERMGNDCVLLQSILYPTMTDTHSNYVDNMHKLQQLEKGDISLVVAYPECLTAYYETNLLSKTFYIGDQWERDDLISFLSACGYHRTDSVSSSGDYAIHGDSVDLYLYEEPVILRCSFFDTELESLTKYSVDTFEKIESMTQYTLSSSMCIPTKDNQFFDKIIKDIDNNYQNNTDLEKREYFHTWKTIVESDATKSFITHQDMYLPYLKKTTLFDRISDQVCIVFDEYKVTYDRFLSVYQEAEKTIKAEIEQGRYTTQYLQLLVSIEEMKKSLRSHNVLAFGNISSNNRWFDSQAVFHIKTFPIARYEEDHARLVLDIVEYHKKGYEIFVFGKTEEFASRMEKQLTKLRVDTEIIKSMVSIKHGYIHLVTKSYPFSVGLYNEKLMVIGSNVLFEQKKAIKSAQNLDVFTELPTVGDYVVHSSYGIARYEGNIFLSTDMGQKEYLVLKYKNDDTVYLPVENLDKLTKFVGTKETPQLSKLGGGEFLKVKAKVKAGLKELAFSLVALYKAREEKKGIVYPRNAEEEKLLDTNFEYTLTQDQKKAIEDVYQDMAQGKIMDRLVCGDVGYGKTEVAMRAILKTVLCGYQVVFLCPTTILSEQHYQTCLQRLAPFGVRVGVLNRFRTTKEQHQLLSQVQNGQIDVLIGTHRALSKDVIFKKLGLMVLDEEQKFGVGDKEKIKNMKKDINVLTLSATPIPRTLHMSLMGIRDISLISMPPLSRKDCITQVVEYSDELLQRVVMQEIQRGGQVLLVYNRVESMLTIYQKIRNLLPDTVSMGMAHGQMEEKELEQAILRLYHKDIDVLLATTLIENGIDLPSANTLFVFDSDQLGLSQLYQLKGRVGRSDKQAYAYFTYEKSKLLSSNAYKRLEAIGQYSTLGSGYKIALRDLEIRGAGNVLGVEQSGHMGKVGYHMYVTLLKEAVDEVESGKVIQDVDTQIVTTLDAYLPETYVEGTLERTSVYTKIAKVRSSLQKDQVYSTLSTEYGPVPKEVDNLLCIALLKNIASTYGFTKVVIRKNSAYLEFSMQFYDNIISLYDNNKDVFVLNMEQAVPRLSYQKVGTMEDTIQKFIKILENHKTTIS